MMYYNKRCISPIFLIFVYIGVVLFRFSIVSCDCLFFLMLPQHQKLKLPLITKNTQSFKSKCSLLMVILFLMVIN